jgi:hypothetical protein
MHCSRISNRTIQRVVTATYKANSKKIFYEVSINIGLTMVHVVNIQTQQSFYLIYTVCLDSSD